MSTSSSPKELAISFLRLAASGNVDEAYELVAQNFRHHNPYFASDAEALKAGMQENAHKNSNKLFQVQRAIAEDSFVAVHSRIQMQSNALTIAVVHIFRFEHGKIAELWDIGQPQPEQMANELGMFKQFARSAA
jgi:predicted SnoaL-like aldol condensation-catalyzing enzyme